MAAIDGGSARLMQLATQPEGGEELAGMVKLLSRALRALGEAGRPADASRLAAQGWSLLRGSNSEAAERLSGLLHYLARLPSTAADSQPAALTKETPT